MPPLSMKGPYFELTLVEPEVAGGQSYLRITRTAMRYPDTAAVEADFRTSLEVVRPYRHLAVLVDMRGSPVPSSDPEFEQAIARSGQGMTSHFKRTAMLVKSAVGALQVKRISREGGFNPHVFTSEAEALAWLLGP